MTDNLESVERLSRDLAKAAGGGGDIPALTPDEARFLVDAYYQMQDQRIRSTNQVRSMGDEPHLVLSWLAENSMTLEKQVLRALGHYADSHAMGRWAQSIVGIGPVLSAGLIAHIDITKAPTVGHIWRFAGLDPTMTWEKGQKRPFNAGLKVLTWKIGESFIKVQGHEDDVYGKLYAMRKKEEIVKNGLGEFADQATGMLDRKKFAKTTDAYKYYSGQYSSITLVDSGFKGVQAGDGDGVPMLPPAHIHARARRWAVKMFLAHFHAHWYELEFGQAAPVPYAIAHLLHTHEIDRPNKDVK